MKSIGEILKQTGLQDGTERASDLPQAPLADEPADDACPHCGGAGFVGRKLQLGHPDFGRAFARECTRDEQEAARQARLLRYSNLGPLSRLTFENLRPRGRSPNSA